MSADADIRVARIDDVAELARLSAELGYPLPVPEMTRRLAAMLPSPNHHVLVASRGERLLGWLHAERRLSLEGGDRAEVMGLVVDSGARRRGLGRALLAAAEDWASRRGVGRLTVRSNVVRESSHPFYESLGYAREKTQHVYTRSVTPAAVERREPFESGFTIALSDVEDWGAMHAILEPLVAFNTERTGTQDHRPLVLAITDGAGRVVGGLWGRTAFGWLHVELVFVPDSLRGRGVGTQLMRRAEAEALVRGCRHAWLDTFEFQARGFYERLGYRCFGELANFPAGFARYFMTKRLAAPPATTTLFRPVGPAELELIAASGFREFPPRLPEQPIFYPVLNEPYAAEIAQRWNVRDSGAGYVTAFEVDTGYVARFEVRRVGGPEHLELWVPAEELAELNRHIVGRIRVVREFGTDDRADS